MRKSNSRQQKERSIFRLYWRTVIRPHWVHVFAVFALMLLAALFETTTIGLGVPLIEAATQGAGASSNPVIGQIHESLLYFGYSTSRGVLLFSLILLISVVGILRSLFYLGQKYWTAVIAQLLRKETKLKLLQKILGAQYAYLAHRNRGGVIYDINQPSQSLYLMINLLGNFFSNAINGLLMVGFMFYLSIPATVIIGISGGGWLFLWRKILAPRLSRHGRHIYELNQQLGKMDVEAIDGIKVIKAHHIESQILSMQEKVLTIETRPKKIAALLTQGLIFVNDAAAAGVLVILGAVTFGLHWIPIPFSKLIVLFLAVRRASPAFSGVGQTYLELSKEIKNVEVLEDILTHTPQEKSGDVRLHAVDTIQFKNVAFFYSQDDKAERNWELKDVNLEMRKGEVVALVGSTGSGKSTLANLLMGFYSPKGGEILINGVSLEKLFLSQWRQDIGYVSQDIFLFNDTIRQNITLWNETISEEELITAVQAAHLHDFITSLPEGYETLVGDRGLKLSGGQCQRIAIARAILNKPKVLIFDEATSALDNLTEKVVYDAIHSSKKNAVVIIIAHRLSTVKDADRIYVLANGRIVEEGTHVRLIQEAGIYSQLYKEGEHRVVGELR